MATEDRVKAEIAEIAQRKNAVDFGEIERIVNQLGQLGYPTRSRRTKETVLFRVGRVRFGVCDHNPGGKHVKACYVKAFLEAMIELGLFEE